MIRWFKNVWTLTLKEFQSLFSDIILLVLIVYIFSVAIVSIATGISTEVRNASVAIVDHDRSQLSRRLEQAFLPPYFRTPRYIDSNQARELMDAGKYLFVLTIPPNFQRDVLDGRHPEIQIQADATTVTQAGMGVTYIQQIIGKEAAGFLHQPEVSYFLPLKPVINTWFNPNTSTEWFLSVMNVANFVCLLALVLVGAAVIRERERGTIEHLLVMPVTASEIAASKIAANGVVIAAAALLSLIFVVRGWLAVPINGSLALFMFGTAIFLFSASALGILLATLAPSMPQFSLLVLPVYIVMRLISGGDTPLESMPDWLQWISQWSPMTRYVQFSADVLARNAGIRLVQHDLLLMGAAGVLFIAIALKHFRSMLDKQG